jgi:hypothetical protein
MLFGMGTVDVCAALSFAGMRGGELEAVTMPPLVSPKGHAAAVRKTAVRNGKAQECDCYPWIGGGATVAACGLLKHATVRGVFGPEWDRMVTDERLHQAMMLDDNGLPIPYVGTAPVNRTKWVHAANGDRMAFKTSDDESRLYASIVIAACMGHAYYDADGNVIPSAIVAPFLPDRSDEGKRQGVADPLVFRDYRADHIAGIRIGKTITAGDARLLADCLSNGGTHPTAKGADGKPLTAAAIAAEFLPSIGSGVIA